MQSSVKLRIKNAVVSSCNTAVKYVRMPKTAVKRLRMLKQRSRDLGARGKGLRNFHRNK